MRRNNALLQKSSGTTNSIRRSGFVLAFLCAPETITASAQATEPAAMVERVTGGPNDLSTFDYLYPGRVINLGSDGSLALIYFQSCLRERILGGQVTIRDHKSSVQGSARLSRSPAGCGQDDRQFYHDDRRTSAAMVFRGQASIEVVDHLAPRFETFDRFDWISIIELPSALEIFHQQPPNKIVDLNNLGLLLKPGGIYRVETNDSYAIFRIDPGAKERMGSKPIRLPHKRSDKTSNGYR